MRSIEPVPPCQPVSRRSAASSPRCCRTNRACRHSRNEPRPSLTARARDGWITALRMAELSVRTARMDDADLLLSSANQPDTRRQSFQSEHIDADEHVGWLARILADPARSLVVVETAGSPAGQVRLDLPPASPVPTVSIALAPAARGRGLGHPSCGSAYANCDGSPSGGVRSARSSRRRTRPHSRRSRSAASGTSRSRQMPTPASPDTVSMVTEERVLRIGERQVGPGRPTYVIAEVSANHGQRINHTLKIVRAAARSGADAVKLQTYTPDTITLDVSRADHSSSGRTARGRVEHCMISTPRR